MSSELIPVLTALMSTDNLVRREAEEFFNSQMQGNATNTMQALSHIFSTQANDIIIRSFAGVLLRRCIEKHSEQLTSAAVLQLRSQLMAMWSFETNPLILRRLSHTMAQSALKSEWNELIPQILEYSKNLQGSALVPILALVEILSDYCPEDILTHLQTLGQFLGQFLSAGDLSVRIACAKTTAACIKALEDDEPRNSFKPALEPILAVLGLALSAGEEEDATRIVNYLVSVANECPSFFRGSLDSVVGAMLQVANAQGLEFSTRSIALELLVTITETAPAMARRCAGLLQGLIPLAISLMLEVEEEEDEWMRGKYTEEPTDDNSAVGDEAIERVAQGMGGKTVSEAVLSLVQQLAGDTSSADAWKRRRAAVASLARLAEGSTKHFKRYLPQAVAFLTSALQDSSPRVQYEGIQAVGRMATLYPDQAGTLIPQFLPLLTLLLHNAGSCDKVRGHAASALINLLNPDSCEVEMLPPSFLDPLLQALLYCLQTAPLEVRSPCLSLVGCIAMVCGDGFVPYYSSFMPGIKSVLRDATAPDLVTLRGKAMECVGLVGEAVGVEVFANDAMEIMQLFMHALQHDKDCDSTYEYILPACARISRALTTQFQPFLPLVMEPLLAGANIDVQFSMVDADDDDVEGEVVVDEDAGTESAVVSLAGSKKRFTVNTTAVQQKTQAARTLYEFADALKGHLKAYILPAMQTLLQLVVERHCADIRSSSALAVGKMFEAFICAIKLGFIQDNPAQNLSLDNVLMGTVTKLLESIRVETDVTARACSAEALRDVLQACYQSGVEQVDGSRTGFVLVPGIPICEKIASEVLAHCAESLGRRGSKLEAIEKNTGYDAEDREGCAEELEEEEELLTTLVDGIGQILKLHGPQFMMTFDTMIAPVFSQYLQPDQPHALQTVAVYLIDDAIEFGGQAAHKFIPSMLPIFVRNAKSDNDLLRQSSVYGLAKAVLVAPQIACAQLSVLLPCLLEIMQDPASQEEENEGTFENAVFALGSICTDMTYRLSLSSMGKPQDLAKVWLQYLPIKTDDLSAKIASKQLCDAVERQDAVVLGEGSAHLPLVFKVIAEVLAGAAESESKGGAGTDATKKSPNSVALQPDVDFLEAAAAHPDTVRRMQHLMRGFTASSSAGDAVQTAFATLSPDLQQTLKNVL